MEGFPVFGSHRRSYVCIGAFLMIFGNLLTLDMFLWNILPLSKYLILLISAFVFSSGVVMTDMVADIWAVDVSRKDESLLGKMSVYVGIAWSAGSLLAALVTSYLATHFSPSLVISLGLFIPIGILGLLLQPTIEPPQNTPNKRLLSLGFLYLAGLVPCLVYDQQLILFILSLLYIFWVGKDFLGSIPKGTQKHLLLVIFAIFAFRVIPFPVEPMDWWIIGKLGADANFLGTLNLISVAGGLVGMFVFGNTVARAPIIISLIVLTCLDLLSNVPFLINYYLHVNSLDLVIFTSSVTAVLGRLAMIPMNMILAKNAPTINRGIYVTVTASFVNLALSAGTIITKWLNEIFPVTQTNFDNLGILVVSCLGVSVLCSIIGIIFLKRNV
jgi:MFS family permease